MHYEHEVSLWMVSSSSLDGTSHSLNNDEFNGDLVHLTSGDGLARLHAFIR
jgi:hypothetical protein